jgi:hypothetical protein
MAVEDIGGLVLPELTFAVILANKELSRKYVQRRPPFLGGALCLLGMSVMHSGSYAFASPLSIIRLPSLERQRTGSSETLARDADRFFSFSKLFSRQFKGGENAVGGFRSPRSNHCYL